MFGRCRAVCNMLAWQDDVFRFDTRSSTYCMSPLPSFRCARSHTLAAIIVEEARERHVGSEKCYKRTKERPEMKTSVKRDCPFL